MHFSAAHFRCLSCLGPCLLALYRTLYTAVMGFEILLPKATQVAVAWRSQGGASLYFETETKTKTKTALVALARAVVSR